MVGIMLDFFQPEPDPNRQRYDLMLKRRQALLELGKLRHSISQHENWQKKLEQQPDMADVLEQQLFKLDELLSQKFCQADSETLQIDIQNIYVHLVKLAKLWWALEQKKPLDKLLIKQFN